MENETGTGIRIKYRTMMEVENKEPERGRKSRNDSDIGNVTTGHGIALKTIYREYVKTPVPNIAIASVTTVVSSPRPAPARRGEA
ncbi:hypothetical protein EVAR_13448_1 [Eumeta japonica]|uniref:Uncharacterized protein n=1 Tax=Eumeta variegata TaxID=151549 RepID=A0A4C1V6P6_EUMVA|nr:hypothetical protein EVAR_13448_1 [Eumeta japonica]